MWKARPVQASEQASLQWVEHMIVSTIIDKQRGAQERSKGRVSKLRFYLAQKHDYIIPN
jgi:hypothetical protein